MKIVCKSATQVPGFGIVRRNVAIEWPDGTPMPPQVVGNFTDADGMPLCNKEPKLPTEGKKSAPAPEEAAAEQARAEKIAKEELLKRTAALGKQKLIAALDASGVTYKAKDSCEELAKKLLRSQGQEID